MTRRAFQPILLALVLLPIVSCLAQSRSALTKSSMREQRSGHSATLLKDGRILIVGGFTNGEQSLSTAEIFDPATLSVSPTKPMSLARQGHSASLLPNGNVLITGGFNGEYLDSAEIFDVKSGEFRNAGSLVTPRTGHSAVNLDDGKILLLGGTGTGWTFLSDAEIFDPRSGKFARTGSMSTARESQTATLLSDGRVFDAGGHSGRRSQLRVFSTCEIYDPRTGKFSAAGEMTIPRHKHDAVRLVDGRVAIIGGADERDRPGSYDSIEVFDPKTGRFAVLGKMKHRRYKLAGTSVLLGNGELLIVGGGTEIEVFDPVTGRSRSIAESQSGLRLFSTATATSDGRVVIAGGYDERIRVNRELWLLDPKEETRK